MCELASCDAAADFDERSLYEMCHKFSSTGAARQSDLTNWLVCSFSAFNVSMDIKTVNRKNHLTTEKSP